MGFLDQKGQHLNRVRTNSCQIPRPHSATGYRSNSLATEQVLPGNQASHQFAQSCPLRLPGPSNCPFGGACHKCPMPKVQAKLKIGRPDDAYEREADQVADQVMRMQEPANEEIRLFYRQPWGAIVDQDSANFSEELSLRYLKQKKDDPQTIGKRESHDSLPRDNPVFPYETIGQNGRGRPLPLSLRNSFEPIFRYSFSKVRVHTGTEADTLSRVFNARAFTTQQDIFFRSGEYNPESRRGKRLIAHELTHVVQQNQHGSDGLQQRTGSPFSAEVSVSRLGERQTGQQLVQRSLLYVPIALAALAAVLLACSEPFYQIAMRRYRNKSDKWRHCWVACEISKTCGNAVAQLAGLSKEAQDLLVSGHGLNDSLRDMVANQICIPPETMLISLPTRIWRESCEDCCNEAERRGCFRQIEQIGV